MNIRFTSLVNEVITVASNNHFSDIYTSVLLCNDDRAMNIIEQAKILTTIMYSL